MEWISVKDRLPEVTNIIGNKSDICLCYSDACLGKYFVLSYDFDNEEFSHATSHDSIYNPITHWMPLPEPPATS